MEDFLTSGSMVWLDFGMHNTSNMHNTLNIFHPVLVKDIR